MITSSEDMVMRDHVEGVTITCDGICMLRRMWVSEEAGVDMLRHLEIKSKSNIKLRNDAFFKKVNLFKSSSDDNKGVIEQVLN